MRRGMHTETENNVARTNRAHFVVLQGPGLGDFFEITDDELVVGSDPFRADIVVRDIEVEPRHAEVYREPGGYVVRGVGAAKGIALNGEVIRESGCGYLLSDGDRLHMGDSVLEFVPPDTIPPPAKPIEAGTEIINGRVMTDAGLEPGLAVRLSGAYGGSK